MDRITGATQNLTPNQKDLKPERKFKKTDNLFTGLLKVITWWYVWVFLTL
jgi:hypothetical protein